MFYKMAYQYMGRFLIVVAVLMISACGGASFPEGSKYAPNPETALVTVYLNTFGACEKNVSFVLEDIVVEDAGKGQPLDVKAMKVHSQQEAGQILVGIAVLPKGMYKGLRLKLSSIQVQGAAAEEDQSLTLDFPTEVNLDAGDSTCLFIRWNLTDCIDASDRFVARISAQGQVMPLAGELIYVACDDIDTIYLVGTDRHQVTAAIGLVGPLGSLKVDSEERRLYVVSGGARSIFVMDCDANRFIDRIALPMTLAPKYMALSDDGEFAYVTDTQTHRVVKVDLANGVVAAQSSAALYAPERILFMETDLGDLLAVSSPTTRQIYILNAENLGLRQTLAAGLEPEGLLYDDGLLYACDRASNAVLVFGVQDGRQRTQISVGLAPTHILAETGGRIYVSNTGEDSLSVIISGQNTALRRILSGPGPYCLAISQGRQALYVANRNDKKLTILDLNSDNKLAEIQLGGMPLSMDQKF